MSLPILALFSRSLRLDSRTPRTYWNRLALAGLILGALIYAYAESLRITAPGLRFFVPIAYINFYFICYLAGAFSAVITEEKEEETLGLLKMSRLNAVAILLGKSTSGLVGALLLLVVQMPFTVLAVTLGGVSLTQILAAYAALFAYMVLLSNVALSCSVCCDRTKTATGLTAILVLAFLISGPLGSHLLSAPGAPWATRHPWAFAALDTLATALVKANPLLRIGEVLRTGFAGHPLGFQVASNLVLALVFFLLAWAGFERFTREQKTPAPRRPLFSSRLSPLRWLGVGRVWNNAIAWKDFYFLVGGRLYTAIKALVLASVPIYLGYLRIAEGRPLPPAARAGAFMMGAALVISALELLGHASRMFTQEIKWGTFPGLMLLPVSTRRLVYLKLMGMLPALIPNGVCFLVGALLCPGGFADGVLFILSPTGWFVLFQYIGFLHLAAYTGIVTRRSRAGPIQLACLAADLFLVIMFFVIRGVNLIAFVAFCLVASVTVYHVCVALIKEMDTLLYERLGQSS